MQYSKVKMFCFSSPSGAVPRGSAKSKYQVILSEDNTLIVKKVRFSFFTGESVTDWENVPVLFRIENYEGELTAKTVKELEKKYVPVL